MDWIDPEDMAAGTYGFTVKNDDGTCYYDEFYSTTIHNDDGSVQTTGPWGNVWDYVEEMP
jgi:hypothetical protein